MIPVYKRVLLKISGEALAGLNGFGIDESVLSNIVSQIARVHDAGVEIGIVVGGGNFWRGKQGGKMDRTTADHMGMLATVINALAMQDALERAGVMTRVQTALDITKVAEPFIARRANRHLEKGRVVIFGCGTGSPFFTTDTAAALRANEIHAQALLLAKNIDGVYDSDPKKNPFAQKFDNITPKDYIEKGLSVMDTAAVALCSENGIPIIAFGLAENDSIMRVLCGEKIGTYIVSK
ncbi:MAG: Uridylate kinase [Firmicutes bacterium ADurb.Bin080]|jgi:uridylate kinase|nr:UMP kinase [Clostridiales bacterium]OQC16491.1 MAG: Uridylate kinase [Firmicutes bacterium ADurb.Bin080]